MYLRAMPDVVRFRKELPADLAYDARENGGTKAKAEMASATTLDRGFAD